MVDNPPGKVMKIPEVTVVIPHFNGVEMLQHCLQSLRKTRYPKVTVMVVDNGSSDQSMEMVKENFPEVVVVESPVNLGYAGGCNLGIRSSHSPYVVLLNNDTEVTPGWLAPLVETAEADATVAAVQPKILSLFDRSRFDYAGAAGGEIDLFGYPFARGRLFNHLENDRGQYDDRRLVFWATGAATLLSRTALDVVGLLDETFFAHMEEIDLNWRMQAAGYRIMVVPDAVVYHQAGGTLGEESLLKMVLNHRNSLLMILRNYAMPTLLWLFPLRILLEFVTVGGAFMTSQPKRALAVLCGILGAVKHWRTVIAGRKQMRAIRRVSDSSVMRNMYRGSAALAYFLRRKKTYKELLRG